MNKKEKDKNIQRILSDIEQFYKNVSKIKKTNSNIFVIDLANRYCQDSKYWLEKGDLITAFGCINYAHGLIDSIRFSKKSREKQFEPKL